MSQSRGLVEKISGVVAWGYSRAIHIVPTVGPEKRSRCSCANASTVLPHHLRVEPYCRTACPSYAALSRAVTVRSGPRRGPIAFVLREQFPEILHPGRREIVC
jgi:hypothetical protein